MSKNKIAMSIGIFVSMMILASCANMGVGGSPGAGPSTTNKWVPMQGETYVDVDAGKLRSTAFTDDYANKLVTFKTSFRQILKRPMISNYNPKDYLGVATGVPGKGMRLFNIAQKKMYDVFSKLTLLAPIQVWGRAFELRSGSLGIFIHKIEKIES